MIQRTKISLEDAAEYENLCDLIGKDRRKDLPEWSEEHNVPYVFETVGVDEVCIFFFPDKIVVAVDGSDKDRREWEGNFRAYGGLRRFFRSFNKKFQKVESSNGYHKNYYDCALIIHKWVDEHTVGYENVPVVYTGHSRGAGIAQVLYFEFADFFHDMCVFFASPRVMLNWRVKHLKENKHKYNVQAYYIKGDVVDNVPPFLLGWRRFANFTTLLPRVKGFNHTSIGKAIKKAIRKRDGKRKSAK